MSELLWIGVPGGADGDGSQLLRVLVVPRLEGTDLAGAGMAEWPPPTLLDAPALTLEWRAEEGGQVTTTPVAPEDVALDATPGLWERFFPSDMELGGDGKRAAPPPMPEVRPTSAGATAIDATFGEPAAIAFDGGAEAGPPPAYSAAVHNSLAQWQGEGESPPSLPLDAPAVPPSPPGFNRIVSLLREHPAVLRALGLIFDLRVSPPAGLTDAGQVRALWPDAPGPAIVSPWTHYGEGFLPFSRSGGISRGMVALRPDPDQFLVADDGGWMVATVDVEGGTRKLRDAAQALPDAGDDVPAPLAMPAMRTAGIQLLHVDRERAMARRRGAALENHARQADDDLVLDADELVLGYRIDIKRGGGDWLSLHERIATYDRGDPADTIGPPERIEEGHVKVNGAVRESDGTLRATEVVARWSGWSLAVPRPPFDAPGAAPRGERRGGLPFAFGWTFQVPPGSLPRLRFADTYAVRARVADMAGGGLGREDPLADRCAISEQVYRRYEPVPSPFLLLETGIGEGDLGPGEAYDRVVVRSAPGVGIDAFDSHNPGYAGRPIRVLRQPHTSLAMAEQHGMLDGVEEERVLAWMQRALAAGDSTRPDPAEGPLPDPAAEGVSVVARRDPGAPRAAFARRSWTPPWPEPDLAKVVELREAKSGKPAVAWEGEKLVVRLAPAQQIVLELSSSLTADFGDHFALHEAMPSASKSAAASGRHPLITPAQAVTLVHAVRKPIDPPDAATRLTPRPREPGKSFALLDPLPVLFGLDAESTAQLDIAGSWTERRDDATEEVVDASVASIVIDRGTAQLDEPVRHELGDTRHRDVTYTLTAVGRFRQFFDPAEEAADPLAFSERRPLSASVSIPSSARPPVPVVLATRPAFAWKDSLESGVGTVTLRRRRLGGRLRVELARPWFASGDGERLAVVLWDRSGGVTPPAGIAELLTEVGRDPIWDTPGPERWPTESAFSGAAGAADIRTVEEAGKPALVLPFEPWFHGGRWHADIGLPGIASSSYCPFVRLAVARYQPASIEGHHLSPIVRTEMTQLLPDRTLTVTQTGAALQVALDGLGPAGPQPNRVDLVLEHCRPGPGVDAGAVELTAFVPDGEVPAWGPVPGQTQQTALGAGPVGLSIPTDLGAVRLRVREVELVGAEAEAPAPQPATPGELAERVVFTDTIALPPA